MHDVDLERIAARQKIKEIKDTLGYIRHGDLLSMRDIPYELLEEGLSLLLRHEQRVFQGMPLIVIIVSGGAVDGAFSEEKDILYRNLDVDISDVDEDCILAQQVEDMQNEILLRLKDS